MQQGAEQAALKTATDDVRTFLNIIAAQVQQALRDIADPGFLQMSRLHPASKQLVPTRYDPSATDTMADDAISDSDAGHNVYLEGRTVRPDLKGPERGKLEDTAWVWAFVVDSDSDKNKSWLPTPAQAPSLVVETSPGNHHFWFFLDKAIRAAEAKPLGDRIRASVGADHASGNVVQPYRIAGTINFPTLEKEKRGRFPTTTRVIAHQGTLWAPDDFVVAFPVPEKKKSNGSADREQREAGDIPPALLELIRDGVEEPHRSEAFHHAVGWLKDLGWTIDGIATLLETYPDGIAAKYAGRIRTEVERSWDKLEDKPPPQDGTPPVVLSKREFLEGFVPPDYLIDGVMQRRFVYSFTAQTGHGKTAIALTIARAVTGQTPNATFGSHGVEKGKGVYFVGENPDDVRMRVIGTDSLFNLGDDPINDRISFIAGVFDIEQMHARLEAEMDKLGGVDLVIIDTSAAYFLGNDEISNTQMGAHARKLRRLTTLPGGPCVLVLCHPIKHVTDPSQLLPRGGGAFLCEMDGNFTGWLHDLVLVDFHHNKIRGSGFEPITFRLEKIRTPRLVDSKGRPIPTIHAVAISETEQERQAQHTRQDDDLLLIAMLKKSELSIAGLAKELNWLSSGEPQKSRVQRVLHRLERAQPKLARKDRDRWLLTDPGKTAARKLALKTNPENEGPRS
jgi:hypothetical protein